MPVALRVKIAVAVVLGALLLTAFWMIRGVAIDKKLLIVQRSSDAPTQIQQLFSPLPTSPPARIYLKDADDSSPQPPFSDHMLALINKQLRIGKHSNTVRVVTCPFRAGTSYCSSFSRPSCCCHWQPTGPCASPFGLSSSLLLFQVSFMPFFAPFPADVDLEKLRAANQSKQILEELKKVAAKSCAGWDTGRWTLPREQSRQLFGANVIQDAVPFGASSPSSAAQSSFLIGPSFVWSFGKILSELSGSKISNNKDNLFIIAGDSMTRQIFSRIVTMARSRMCSNNAERQRPGVVEQYFHHDAAYIATDASDKMFLGNGSCAEMLEQFVFGGGAAATSAAEERPILMICFFWAPSWNAEDKLEWKLLEFNADLRRLESGNSLAKKITVAAFFYMSSVWGCQRGDPAKGNLCSTPDQFLALSRRAARNALQLFDAKKILISTTPVKNAHSWNQTYVGERNEALRMSLPFDRKWLQFSGADSVSSLPTDEQLSKRLQLFDLEKVRAEIGLIGCDRSHGMCTFMPTRPATTARGIAQEKAEAEAAAEEEEKMRLAFGGGDSSTSKKATTRYRSLKPVNGMNFACPGTSRCVDPLDYDQVLYLMRALLS